MIDIWYLNTKDISQADMNGLLNVLPAKMIKEITRFRYHNDRRLKLFGKMIVQKYHAFLKEEFSWSNWLTSSDGKPHYLGGKEFNISHSGDMVAVAFSDKKVGLDIEKCASCDIKAITNYLHVNEQAYIECSDNIEDAFFTVWTRKEAYLKAKGVGIVEGLNNENCLEPQILSDKKWFITSLSVIPNYKLAFCSEIESSSIELKELELTEFYEL